MRYEEVCAHFRIWYRDKHYGAGPFADFIIGHFSRFPAVRKIRFSPILDRIPTRKSIGAGGFPVLSSLETGSAQAVAQKPFVI
jgi:hypothetical protein